MQVQINSDGIDVTWVSAAEEEGLVEWARDPADLANRSGPGFSVARDSRIERPDGRRFSDFLNKRTHRVRISGVPGGSTVYYNIVSGGVSDPKGPYQVLLPERALITPADFISGTVTYQDASLGKCRECLVYVRVEETSGSGTASLWVNTMTDRNGGYIKDVTNLRRSGQAFNTQFSYVKDRSEYRFNVAALSGRGGEGSVSRSTADAEKSASGFPNFDIAVAGPGG